MGRLFMLKTIKTFAILMGFILLVMMLVFAPKEIDRLRSENYELKNRADAAEFQFKHCRMLLNGSI
jgi:hypothetical protein